MYLKYVSMATSTGAQVVADLALLASGGSIASCSASCDKVNSTVLANTLAPGWTLFDSAAPLSGAVISCLDYDARTTKYARFQLSTATTIAIDCYETYNATTHAGTNASLAYTPASYHLTYSAVAVNNIMLLVEPRFVIIGNSAGTLLSGVLEVSRDIAYLSNTGSMYPVSTAVNHTLGANTAVSTSNFCRMKNLTAAGDITGATASVALNTACQSAVQTTPLLDNLETPYHPIYPLFAAKSNAVIGRIQNVFMTTGTFGAAFDEVSDGTMTYVVIGSGGHALVAKA